MNTPTAKETEVTHLEKLRSQLSTDIETMQQKEASLREYEQKLRVMVEQVHASNSQPQVASRPPLSSRPPQSSRPQVSSRSPLSEATTPPGFVPSTPSMEGEWEKYRRANALLEAARSALTDERLALKEREARMTLREEELARREAWVRACEQQLTERADVEKASAAKGKSRPSFTVAPFLAAKNLLSLGKSS